MHKINHTGVQNNLIIHQHDFQNTFQNCDIAMYVLNTLNTKDLVEIHNNCTLDVGISKYPQKSNGRISVTSVGDRPQASPALGGLSSTFLTEEV